MPNPYYLESCQNIVKAFPYYIVDNYTATASSNDQNGCQILNAKSFKKNGFSYVIEEEELSCASLLNAIRDVAAHKEQYVKAMKDSEMSDSIGTIMKLITSLS